ncbi:MAG: peptidylprolyl isomerase [bacterium]|nr:peptidylprolyl isomerase [bacterium]
MKKIILLSIIILLTGVGCSEATNTPQVKAAKQNNQIIKQEKESMRNLPQHKDLAAEFTKAILKTNKGDITVEFYNNLSPITVNNFLNLSESGVYSGTKFHRVIKDFMIQGGDPNSKTDNVMSYGTGDPGYKFNDEFNSEPLVRGSLAMANSGPNTNGSQFFIVTAPATPWLDRKHTNFGKVIEGMDVVDSIDNSQTDARDLPVEPIVIESIELLK